VDSLYDDGAYGEYLDDLAENEGWSQLAQMEAEMAGDATPLRECPACGVECLTPSLDLCPGCAADAAEAGRLRAPGRDDDGAGLPAWDGEELPW
jgi:hypothetical protein